MSRKRYLDRYEPDIFNYTKNDENSKLNEFQDKLRMEAEEMDKSLDMAWKLYDREKIKKLKSDVREVLRDISNLTINSQNTSMSQSIKKRKSKRSGMRRKSRTRKISRGKKRNSKSSGKNKSIRRKKSKRKSRK